MVLELPKKGSADLPLKQRDVRETAGISGTPIIGDFTSSQHSHAAAGATGGTVDHTNLTSIGTNSHAQIDTHIGNTANPHTVILSDVATAGEGIDFSGATIQGENASTSNKGIASFHADDFVTSSGVVNLDADVAKTFDGDSGTATTAIHNIDILGGTGITTAGANNDITITNTGVTSAVAGEGINISGATGAVTISGEDATTANKGIATFNSNNFDVAAGDVTLGTQGSPLDMGTNLINNVTDPSGNQDAATKKYVDDHVLANKTSYLSIPFSAFTTASPDTDNVSFSADGSGKVSSTAAANFICPVYLPQGSVVTSCVVYGNAGTSDETWYLYRNTLTAATSTEMATAAFGTTDSTITSGTVDNATYYYHIFSSTMTAGDEIYGALITYTTDYI